MECKINLFLKDRKLKFPLLILILTIFINLSIFIFSNAYGNVSILKTSLIDNGLGNLDILDDGIQQDIDEAAENIESNINPQIDININYKSYSGKIADAKFNLNTGQIERIFFGNWNLENKDQNTNFTASFITRNTDTTDTTNFEYKIENTSINSVQKTNNLVQFGGIADIIRRPLAGGENVTNLENLPIKISIIENKIIAIIFEKSAFTLSGVVTCTTADTN